MSYRGSKYLEHQRALKKRSLVQENPSSGIHNRGLGGKYRARKRQEKKRLLAKEAERKLYADELLEQAKALLKEAALYEPWCPEEAQKLIEQADKLYLEAEKVLLHKKEADFLLLHGSDEETSPRPEAGSFRRAEPCTSYRYRSYTPPRRNPDPEIVALAEAIRSGERNFMGGISYRINPVDTLKMISASSVFGEPQYYRDGENTKATVLDGLYGIDEVFARYSLSMLDLFQGMTTSQVMEKAIDDALTADFEATLLWAVELRERYLMRLNPQVILVRAASHPGRAEYTSTHPGEFARIARKVMFRGDDVINQVQYWLAQHGSKRGIPAILKRSWAQRISGMDAYSMAKYGRTGIGLVDVVRICHAKKVSMTVDKRFLPEYNRLHLIL